MPLPLLRDVDERFKTQLVVVSCAYCNMTMFGNSSQAHVNAVGKIVCNNCLMEEEK